MLLFETLPAVLVLIQGVVQGKYDDACYDGML